MDKRHAAEEAARWQRAFDRVGREHIRVVALPGTGAWIATGSRPGAVYQLGVQGNLATSCSCAAGQAGDPVCKHKAAYYVLLGVALETCQG